MRVHYRILLLGVCSVMVYLGVIAPEYTRRNELLQGIEHNNKKLENIFRLEQMLSANKITSIDTHVFSDARDFSAYIKPIFQKCGITPESEKFSTPELARYESVFTAGTKEIAQLLFLIENSLRVLSISDLSLAPFARSSAENKIRASLTVQYLTKKNNR